MGILGRIFAAALVALAGCYSPAVRDCTVSCSSPNDCAGGQICGDDGLCAAPEVAGRCKSVSPDAGPRHGDAASSDSAAFVSLHVQVSGKGSVVVVGRGTCSSQDPQHGDCNYEIEYNVAQSVRAIPIQPDHVFSEWTSVTCNGQDASCMFTPVAATIIVAKFEHN